MSRSNWKKNKSIFGLDFVFGEIPDHLIPFDWDTFRSYEGTCLVGVTNAKTGQIEYKNAMDMDEKFTKRFESFKNSLASLSDASCNLCTADVFPGD